MAKLVEQEAAPGQHEPQRPKEKASPSARGTKLILLLSLFAIVMLKQDNAMNISKYRLALGVVDEDPRFGVLNSSDNNNNDVVVAAPVAVAVAVAIAPADAAVPVAVAPTAADAAPAVAAVGNHTSSTSTTFRLPSSEWLDDIDTEAALGCGQFKCAFPSRTTKRGDDDDSSRSSSSSNSSSSSSSRSHDPDRDRYGYLVTRRYKDAERTFAFAQKLSERWSVKHTLAANPVQFEDITTTTKVVGETETETTTTNTTNTNTTNTNTNTSSSSSHFVVQPIKLYSDGSYLFKCNNHLRTTDDPWEWADKLVVHSANVDPLVFQERLRFDHKKTTRMLASQSSHSKCLTKDFQLAIDAITGSILHIDLDRCWQKFRKKFLRKKKNKMNVTDCMQELESIIERLIARKNYLYYNSTTTTTTIDDNDNNDDNNDDHHKTTKKAKSKHKGERQPGDVPFSPINMVKMIDRARNPGNRS